MRAPLESHAYEITKGVPVVGPYPAGSIELAEAVAQKLKDSKSKAVIIRTHGLVVMSESLDEAFDLPAFIEKVSREM
jgi:ribulose-5-phosphate 4-epimerase/fuculose-1-phosphate aldolase